MHINSLAKLALLAGVLSGGCSSGSDPQPGGTSGNVGTPTITVKVSEAGAPTYDLNDAHVVSSNYQSGSASMVITGKLNSGSLLTLNFAKAGTAPAYSTNSLEATLGNETAASPTGTTTFDPTARTVDGSFRTTFSGPGVVTGSFTKVSLQ